MILDYSQIYSEKGQGLKRNIKQLNLSDRMTITKRKSSESLQKSKIKSSWPDNKDLPVFVLSTLDDLSCQNMSHRASGPLTTRRDSEKYLYNEARKVESRSVLIPLINWRNVAETIWFVSVPLSFPQERSMGINLRYPDMSSGWWTKTKTHMAHASLTPSWK